jgi:hypothetical protein
VLAPNAPHRALGGGCAEKTWFQGQWHHIDTAPKTTQSGEHMMWRAQWHTVEGCCWGPFLFSGLYMHEANLCKLLLPCSTPHVHTAGTFVEVGAHALSCFSVVLPVARAGVGGYPTHRNACSCVPTATPCSHDMYTLGAIAVVHRHALSESYDPHLCHFGHCNTLRPATSTCRLHGSSETPTAWMRVDTSRRGY